jgi:hypothetical protein
MVMERKAKLNAIDEKRHPCCNISMIWKYFRNVDPREAQASAIESVRPMRYEDDGYFWINDMSTSWSCTRSSRRSKGRPCRPQGPDREVLLPGVHQGGEG